MIHNQDYFQPVKINLHKTLMKHEFVTEFKRSDTGFSLLSLEEVELKDEPVKPANFNETFKKPGTNIALRRASTVRFAEGTKEGPSRGPPQIRKMSCIDEAPKQSRWQGLLRGFKNLFSKTSKVQEIKA